MSLFFFFVIFQTAHLIYNKKCLDLFCFRRDPFVCVCVFVCILG